MKKAKTKATSHKASLAKLANKRTNRLAKQGKLHKADKKKRKKKALQEIANKKQQQQQQIWHGNNGSIEDVDDDDICDENIDYFQHLKNAHVFAKADLNTE